MTDDPFADRLRRDLQAQRIPFDEARAAAMIAAATADAPDARRGFVAPLAAAAAVAVVGTGTAALVSRGGHDAPAPPGGGHGCRTTTVAPSTTSAGSTSVPDSTSSAVATQGPSLPPDATYSAVGSPTVAGSSIPSASPSPSGTSCGPGSGTATTTGAAGSLPASATPAYKITLIQDVPTSAAPGDGRVVFDGPAIPTGTAMSVTRYRVLGHDGDHGTLQLLRGRTPLRTIDLATGRGDRLPAATFDARHPLRVAVTCASAPTPACRVTLRVTFTYRRG